MFQIWISKTLVYRKQKVEKGKILTTHLEHEDNVSNLDLYRFDSSEIANTMFGIM